MKKIKKISAAIFALSCALVHAGELKIVDANGGKSVSICEDSKEIIGAPHLWKIGEGWENQSPANICKANASKIEKLADAIVLSGELNTPSGLWALRDTYTFEKYGIIKCVRRYHFKGKKTAEKITLVNSWVLPEYTKRLVMPSIIYYGNPSGWANGKNRVPTFDKEEAPEAIFEEHRFPMPFVAAEVSSGGALYGAALHTLPSMAPHANKFDQWWSLGARVLDGKTEFASMSGAVAINGKWGMVKSRQKTTDHYDDAYLNVPPNAIIEKVFYLQTYPLAKEGSLLNDAVGASLEIFKPYDTEDLPEYKKILFSKLNFAKSRWLEGEDYAGFNMYGNYKKKQIVFGWCGQAASPAYAFQSLLKDDTQAEKMIQKSLDFLSLSPFNEEGFFSIYDIFDKKWILRAVKKPDYLSQAQGMQNFAMAIHSAKKSGNLTKARLSKSGTRHAKFRNGNTFGKKKRKFDTSKWDAFLQKAADFHAERILKDDWCPLSTSEAFMVAPLCKAYEIYKKEIYKRAALKAADHYAARHLDMKEPYWGGTLDAICEDKEGAWAAMQAFIAAYEMTSNKKYLEFSKHAADVVLSYTMVWDVQMPPSRLGDLGFKSRGWTSVSPQNQHLDVYGVLYTPQLCLLSKYTGCNSYKKLAKIMYLSCGQLIDAYGSQGEQIQQTNFGQYDKNADLSILRGGYAENWTVFWITSHFINAAAQLEEMGFSHYFEN